MENELCRYLTFGPNIASKYDSVNESLLLVLYFKNPPGRIMRKQWTSDYNNMPDFESWLRHFKDYGTNSTDYAKFMDKTEFLDIDDKKAGLIRHNDKLMHPSDNSVIKTSKFSIGKRVMGKSTVLKDNLHFGIREPQNREHFGEEFLSDELRSNLDSRCEFWMHLNDNSRLLVEI